MSNLLLSAGQVKLINLLQVNYSVTKDPQLLEAIEAVSNLYGSSDIVDMLYALYDRLLLVNHPDLFQIKIAIDHIKMVI